MDCYGKAPMNGVGRYYRQSVWGWRPLAEYVTGRHPDLTKNCRYWFSNDGDGLGMYDAVRLAEALREDVASGVAAAYVKERREFLDSLPRLTCRICEGKGRRTPADDTRLGVSGISPKEGMTCNGCSGAGTVKDDRTMYGLGVEDIREFAAFCAASGGFEIL